MKYFISYFVFHRYPYANMWSPENLIIDQHPLKWIENYPDFKLMWWKELSDAEIS